jgi:hypothetical protein
MAQGICPIASVGNTWGRHTHDVLVHGDLRVITVAK